MEVDSQVEAEIEDRLPKIQQKAHENAIKQVKADDLLEKGEIISNLSPFISDTITINGKELDKSMFIPERPINDPISEDVRLYFDDLNFRWLVNVKEGKPKLVSRFVVEACIIVDASGPGSCRAFVVFLKGRTKPLIFLNGNIESAMLRKQTHFQQRGLSTRNKDYYHESFIRSLCMCQKVCFLTLPKHAGWNLSPYGSQLFVSAEMMLLEFNELFVSKKTNPIKNVFSDIILEHSDRAFDEIVNNLHRFLTSNLFFKISTVISVMSRLLPFFKDEGLTQDRAWVVETSDDDTARSMIAVVQNRNHQSTEVLFSSMRLEHIKEEIKKYVDCVAVMRHLSTICSKHDFKKILKLLFELLQNTYVDDSLNRMVPVLIIDRAGIIPEELSTHQLSLTERLKIDNIEQVQKLMGELHYQIVKLAERNPDAVKQLIKESIGKAKEMAATLPRKSQSSSAIMLLSTATMLKEGDVLTEIDVKDMLQWLHTEAKSRTSMSRCVSNSVGEALSDAICRSRLLIANQFGPPFWTPNKALIASDESLNVSKDFFDDEILYNVPVGRNKALQYLKDEDVLFHNNGEDQKTWNVETEDGKKPRRFYSFSRDLLTLEANRIVDKAIASDLFHKLDKPINNFFPFIKHKYMDMIAGQVITDYKHGNPFIDVTGTPGSGKTDWMMMQVVQRAKAGDVVVVLDPTNAFCREELLGHKIPADIIDNHFKFWDTSIQGWPINILDIEGCEDITQCVQRLSSLLISGMHLSSQNQKAIVMTKVTEWLEENEIDNKLSIYSLPARFDGNADERKLKTKLDALLSTVKETKNGVQSSGWDKLLCDRGKVLVVSCGNATINVDANPFDVLFDTLYAYKDKNRDATMTVILDEVQTLNHHKNSTLVNILSRVRKLNLSVILASQDYLNSSLQKVYDYCGTHVLFRPLGEECIKAVAELTKLNANVIRTLPDFYCAIMGSIYSEYSKRNIQLGAAIMGETYRPPYVGNYDN